MNKISNSSGKIYYGIHFYPGVAEYKESDDLSYRIFLNEDTIRKMDPSFAGKPVFVEHVDDVEQNIDKLRGEADGWVVESFFNAADGKHWVKFIVVSEKAERAIKQGLRLSNSYFPLAFGQGGLWNGVTYDKEVTDGAYEHLAIVKTPRYEESVIMTPEQFKAYNDKKLEELKKLSNSKDDKGDWKMKLSFFKKQKVENAADFESMCVTLPKSGKEKTLLQIINEADEHEEKKKENMADHKAMVKLHDDSMCNVAELVEKHKAMHDELMALKKEHEALKAKKHDDDDEDMHNDDEEIEHESEIEMKKKAVEVEGDKHNDDDEDMGDEEAKKKALELAEHEEKEIEMKKKKNSMKHFEALKNAHKQKDVVQVIELDEDKIARGRARYGSGK